MINTMDYFKDLIKAAQQARNKAYAPYSGITVGASLLTSCKTVFYGANIENASYPAGICGERAAFTQALLAGKREFIAIAIVGGIAGKEAEEYFYPCGICRQWMAEFCQEDFMVLIAKNCDDFQQLQLSQLLPYSFGPAHLK
ncbi:MAG: cytidine deaminase [Firmicutes bacterium]|nr:cytidine deaminase [Bacillota bacterium]